MNDLLETAIRRRDGMKAEIERLERFIRVGEEMLVEVGREQLSTAKPEQAQGPVNLFTEVVEATG